MVVINKRMNAINKALANAKWISERILRIESLADHEILAHMHKSRKAFEIEICGHISLKYCIEYHESIFKPYYEGLVTKDELLLALEGAKFNA